MRETTPARKIVAKVCNDLRDSDVRADNPTLVAAFDFELARLEADRDRAYRAIEEAIGVVAEIRRNLQ